MDLPSQDLPENSQPFSQLPEVSSTPCFVVLDSQSGEGRDGDVDGSGSVGTEATADTRIQRLRQLGHLNKSPDNEASKPEEEHQDKTHADESIVISPKDPNHPTSMSNREKEVEEEEEEEVQVSSTQEDLFVPESSFKEREEKSSPSTSKDASRLICTPSETLSSLRLSGTTFVQETSGSSASINVIEPSPEAYGPPPVIIPNTPPGPDTSRDASRLICTPSETVGSLHLSGTTFVQETSGSSASINVVEPSPGAYGPPPVIIPNSPEPDTSREEPMDTSENEEPETNIIKMPAVTRKSTTSGDDSEDAYIPAWQEALNQQQRREEAARAASQDSWLLDPAHPDLRRLCKPILQRGQSKFTHGIPAWQEALNQQQRREEAARAASQDSWLLDPAHPASPKSTLTSVDSANPSSSLSENANKSSVESLQSQSLQQQQPPMISTTDESSRQSTGSRPPSATTVRDEKKTGLSSSDPAQGNVGMGSSSAQENQSLTSHQRHSSLPEESVLKTTKTKPSGVNSERTDGDVQGQQSAVGLDIRKRPEEPLAPCLEDVQEVFVVDDVGTGERADDADIVGPSQDWDLRLSPSQTQTQTQYSVLLREQITRNILSQQADTHHKDLDIPDENKREEIEVVEGPSRIEQVENVGTAEDSVKDKRPATGRRLLGRQATPWHATPSGTDAGTCEDAAPIEILDSEDQVEGDSMPCDAANSTSKETATKHGNSGTKESSKNAAFDASEEGAGDSVFLEGVEPWLKERRRSGGFRESDFVEDQSPITEFHMSMPKDGVLPRPTSVTPRLLRKSGRQVPDRTPRHCSTPIGEEPSKGSKDGEGTSPADQGANQGEPKASSALVVSAVMDLDSAEHSEIPEFHMEVPTLSEKLLKETKESPIKKQTSVFSKVLEARTATKKPRKLLSEPADKSPFSLPKSHSFLQRRKVKQGFSPPTRLEPTASKDRAEKGGVGDDKNLNDANDKSQPFLEENLPDTEDLATIPVVYDDDVVAGNHEEEMEEEVGNHEEEEVVIMEVDLEEEKEEEEMEKVDVDRDPQEVGVADVPDTEVVVDVSIKENQEGGRKEQSCQVDTVRSDETPRESVSRKTHGKGRGGRMKEVVEEDASKQKQDEWALEDEMTILAQFLHSESGSGTDTKGGAGPQPKPSNQRTATPAPLSRVPSEKHVTIATEDIHVSASQGTRGRRDPYEFTESQSNKTPTPMKTWSRKESTPPKEALPSRNLDKALVATSSASVPVPGTRKTPRKRKRVQDKNQSTEEEEGGGATSVKTPAKTRRAPQKTKKGSEDKGRKSGATSAEPKQVPGQSPVGGQPGPWMVVQYKKVTLVQEVKEVIKWGKMVNRTILNEEIISEVIEKIEQDFVTPSPQSKSSSLTSGSLADISSLGSRSSSMVGSMQKSSSSVSAAGMQKSISLSSISEADNSLPKTISLPGSAKSSPNASGHENSATGSRIMSPSNMDQQQEARLGRTRSSPGFPRREESMGADSRNFTSPLNVAPVSRTPRISPSSARVVKTTPPLGQRKSASGTKSPGNVSSLGQKTRTQGRLSRTDSNSSSSATSPEIESRKGSEFARPHRTPSRKARLSSPDQAGQDDSVPKDSSGNKSKRKSSSLGSNRGHRNSPGSVSRETPQKIQEELNKLVLLQSSEDSEGIPCAQPPPKGSGRVSSDEPMEQSDRENVEGSTIRGGEGAAVPDPLAVNLPGADVGRQDMHPKTRPSRGRRKAKKSQRIVQNPDDTQVLPVEEEDATPILISPPTDPVQGPGAGDDASSTSELTDSARPFLMPGVRVYTRWTDGFFYPGTIKAEEKKSRLKVAFDDGDVRVVNSKDVIIKDWLTIGQSVMAESPDGFHYPGIVTGYYRGINGREHGYAVETDGGKTSRYPKSKVILSRDQATLLMTSCTSSSTGVSDISLENLVDGPRQRSRLRTAHDGERFTRTPSHLISKTQSPRRPASPSVTRSGGKRKLVEKPPVECPASPSKRAKHLLHPTLATVSSPDLSKQGITVRRSPRKHQPLASPARSLAGPSTSGGGGPAGSPRSTEALLGPLPRNKTLFKGMAFLLTQGELKKRPKILSDSSTSESDMEDDTEYVPFDKDYARRQIEAGGGTVLKDYKKSQKSEFKVYLIANTYCRTKKYFLALAVNLPCLSHLWLRDCTKAGKLQSHKAYLLPAGESLEHNKIVEWKSNRLVLSGLKVFLVSQYYDVESTWRSILMAAGCHMVQRFPNVNELDKGGIAFDCNVVITDPTCPGHVLHRTQQLAIPVVSVEWVMQCLINGSRLPYTGHARYSWDYKENIGK